MGERFADANHGHAVGGGPYSFCIFSFQRGFHQRLSVPPGGASVIEELLVRRTLLALATVLVLGASDIASADVVYSTVGSTYSQTFDSLANSGTTNTWSDDSTIQGWFGTRETGGAFTQYRGDNGSSNAGALYSFGSTGSNERALGSVASGTPDDIDFGVRFANNTGFTLNAITITYDGEQWRNGGNTTAQTLSFSYLIGDPTITLTSSGYTPVAALNFTGPVASSTAAIVDGNAAGKVAGITATIMGVSWQPGQQLFLKWSDIDDTGNDHGLAIDNFSLSAVPEASSFLFGGLIAGVFGVGYISRRVRAARG